MNDKCKEFYCEYSTTYNGICDGCTYFYKDYAYNFITKFYDVGYFCTLGRKTNK